ncbi:MAG: glycosyltransferase [Desulfobulbus sp.]|uniref:glycosyltransferase n=1 Tax=Desulfobulbus sp. TaxID=895 RepID=UPI002840B94F|nr:glycosyltransferase [Desulfobulbus sp.]MDR2548601.1 glycosyltransferase [Desulfobulbus sp.]
MKENPRDVSPGFFSRLCVRILMLPAGVSRADSFREWIGFWGRGWLFWHGLALEYRFESAWHPSSQISRRLVNLSTAVASAIIKQGGLSRLITFVFHILAHEGVRGIRVRYSQTLPPPAVFKPVRAGINTNRILICDHRIPRPDSSAGDFTTMGILRDAAALGYEVVFLPADYDPSPEYAQEVKKLGITVITSGSGYASPVAYVACEGHSFSVFYFIRLNVAEYLIPAAREASPKAAIIFHAPDLVHLREERQALLEKSSTASAAVTRQRELTIIKKSDVVVVLSDIEKKLLEQNGCTTKMELFSALYAPVPDTVPGFLTRKDVFFLGGFSHTPNIDAVLWFAGAIWPRIHAVLPEASFRIIGAAPTRQVIELGNIPGVKTEGFVADLTPVLAEMRLGVAPLRFGAGIKGKVALTMGAGIPCICSPIAAEGMGIDHGCAFLLAETEADYIEKTVRLYQDAGLWETLSKAGASLIQERFGLDACKSRLAQILEASKQVH